ncbi:undecaprenyl pyrophosphate synthetase [Syntrophus aciditrophicus SB]|uniref:Isoprenyl transferase n=1 Tax=Syntrophus aciditrophicus (strain SB) TaxID=56780 RepID=Q2LTR1_SYNAS|nr:undecaprenyl pyrophosphate synthetase [Syntrophus aciditrophicus SB]
MMAENKEASGKYLKDLDPDKMPRHIAIIMDGNGRWAEKHTLGRIFGHKKGAEAVHVAVRTCRELGVKYLTLYAFSIENWFRPTIEINALMNLLEEYLSSQLEEMMEYRIRLKVIGDFNSLRDSVKKKLRDVMDKTASNDAMTLTLALSYGGRDEILSAVKQILKDGMEGRIKPENLDRELFSHYLYTAEMPDPDLLIRTSGEYRISNFCLWQIAYTEFHFTEVLWPDFSRDDMIRAIADYQSRERRFGMTSEQVRVNHYKS